MAIIFGKFFSERLNYALLLVNNWVKERGLEVNPAITDLVVFTRKRSIPMYKYPRINVVNPILKKTAKHLGVILDSKLSWKENIDD